MVRNLKIIWHALQYYREEGIPEGVEKHYDEEWDAICTAMWDITDALGIEDDEVLS